MGGRGEGRMPVPDALQRLCREVQDAGGRAWVVGGAVRDSVLGLPVSDLDVEVHGIAADRLERILRRRFALDVVGRAFGVIKLRDHPIDVALPRREMKVGRGHRGFMVESDPHMGLAEAASRRDFTMNAMAFDPLTGELADPLDGRGDLARRRLRHCSPAFADDPLRVLRGMQFAARFDLVGDDATLRLCRGIEPEGLAAERIWQEWRKLLLQGRRPSAGLRFLRASGWLRHFPALAAMDGCAQDPATHPEGDVYAHTGLCLDVFADQRVGDELEDTVVGLAVLCHDTGEPLGAVGAEVASVFLVALTGQPALVRQVAPLIATLDRARRIDQHAASDAAVRRLARDAGRIDRLVRVLRADLGGRGPAGDPDPAVARWLADRAAALEVVDAGPPPIIAGRHLLRGGRQPGPWVGEAIRACYDAQLDGAFTDEAGGLEYLRAWLVERERGGRQ